MSITIKVGMGEYKLAQKPDVLTTLGLGSCVGICIYDKTTGIIGMAHIMLPTITQARDTVNIGKFADTAIPALIRDMIALGARKAQMTAKIAGGAQMFSFSKESDLMKIGLRNTAMTKDMLKELGIPLLAEECGGSSGRTIELLSEDGSLVIKTAGKEVRIL